MFRSRLLGAAITMAALSAPFAGEAWAEPIGEASRVIDWAYRTPDGGQRQDLFHQGPVEINDTVTTIEGGELEITFDDGSQLRLDGGTSVLIDEFVYAGNDSDRISVNIGAGTLRFITGAITPAGVKIDTPLATLGVRGTDFLAEMIDPTLLTIWLLSGKLVVVPLNNAAGAGGALPPMPPYTPESGIRPDGTAIAGEGTKVLVRREGTRTEVELLPISNPEFNMLRNRLSFQGKGLGGGDSGFQRTPEGGDRTSAESRGYSG